MDKLDNFELNDAQKQVTRLLASQDYDAPKMVLWSGDVRSGKTWGMALGVCVSVVRRGRGGQFILAGTSVGAIERNILPSVEYHAGWMGLSYRYIRSRHVVELGDCLVHIFGGNDSRSQDAVQGLTAAGAFVDEVVLLPESFVMQIVARCSEPHARVIMTCNPGSPGSWVKRQLFDRAEEMNAITLHSGISDNPSIEDETIDWYGQVFTGHYRARMLEGKWAGASGLVFPRWESADVPSPAGIFDCSIDWGSSNPTAALVVVRVGDSWVVSDEYYYGGRDRAERTVAEHASGIEGFADYWGSWDRVLIDPSAASLRAELHRRGIMARRGNNDVERGLQALSTALALGKVRISENAPELRREVMTLEWDEKRSAEGVDRPLATSDNHACDALRYWGMDRLPPSALLRPVGLPLGF